MTEHKSKPLIFSVIKAPAASLSCTSPEKMVLISYVDALNPARNGTLAWPGRECIAEQTGLNEKTVRRAIARLCELDLIKFHRRTGRCNMYTVNVGLIHRLIDESGQRVHSEKAARTESPLGVGTESTLGGQKVHLNTNEAPNNSLPDIPSFGSSSSLNVYESDHQRQLALVGVVAGVTDKLRITDKEQPTKEKNEERRGIA